MLLHASFWSSILLQTIQSLYIYKLYEQKHLFTDAIETEGSIYVIWDAIPGISNKFGEASVHSLRIFIVSVHIIKALVQNNPFMHASQSPHSHRNTHHLYFSMKQLVFNSVNSHAVQGLTELLWFTVQLRSHQTLIRSRHSPALQQEVMTPTAQARVRQTRVLGSHT